MPQFSLDKVEIHGFRGLRHLLLDGLGQITVLVGPNNSGKTSVLEAMSILCKPLEPLEWSSLVRRRDFGGLDETRLQSLRWCFHQSGQLENPESMFEGTCEIGCDGYFPLRRLRVVYRDILGEPVDPTRQGRSRVRAPEPEVDVPQPRRGAEIAHFPAFENRLPSRPEEIRIQIWEDDLFFHRPAPKRDHLPTETLTPYSYQVNRMQVRYLSESLAGRRGMALDLIREFDPDVQSIEVASFRGARPAIYLLHRRFGPAPLSVFGDALRRVVLLASTITAHPKGLLFIDEVETGIHVSAMQRVFTWLTSVATQFEVQVVATTHSLEAVDAFLTGAKSTTNSFVAFHLDQTPEATHARRFDKDLLGRLRRERGLDVR